MNRLQTSFVALLAILPAGAMAQTTVTDLDDIVVTANREATKASRVGATVVVVTQDDIRDSGETSLANYFRHLSGITVNTRGTIGTQATVLLRGASQNYIAATFDGIDVTDPSGTQVSFDFGQMTTGDIGRIEVLKGSQSALYGAGAVGGVISMNSRRPTEDGLHHFVEAEVGSFASKSLSYGLTYRDATHEAAFTLGHVGTDGFSNAASGTEADGFQSNRVSFYLAHTLQSGVQLGLSGFAEKSKSDYDPAFYLPASLLGSRQSYSDITAATITLGDGATSDEALTRETVGLRAFADFSTGAVDHTVSLSSFMIRRAYHESEVNADYSDYDSVTDTYGIATMTTDAAYTGRRLRADWNASMDAFGGRLSFGADINRETLEQGGDYGAADNGKTRGGLVAEYAGTVGAATDYTLSARLDSDSIFGKGVTARFAMAHQIGEGTTLRFQAGTGFRAPSNFELFSDYGSPLLQPEKSRNVDIGLEQALGTATVLRATSFFLQVDNLIDYDSQSTICPASVTFGPGCYDQIEGSSIRRGLELEAATTLSHGIELQGSYTYTDSQTNASSAWAEVPAHKIALDIAAPVSSAITARLGVMAALQRPDWSDGSAAPDYALANASLSYDLGKGSEAYLRIENLTDADYELAQDYGTPRRSVYVGLRAKF